MLTPQEDAMTDISIAARSPSVNLISPGHGSGARRKAPDDAPEIRSVTRCDRGRFEAAMTMAFSADPAARWAWADPLQFIRTFMPLVTLFGGKSFEHRRGLGQSPVRQENLASDGRAARASGWDSRFDFRVAATTAQQEQ